MKKLLVLGLALCGALFVSAQTPAPPPVSGAKPVIARKATDYVGRYPLSPHISIDVTENKGVLRCQLTGKPSFALQELGPDRYVVDGAPAEISFDRDASGKVSGLVLHQQGLDTPAPRHELPPPPKEVELPVETLREYAGAYAIQPTFILTVSEDKGALFIQATGQAKAPVYATAKDEFFYKIIDAQVSFQRDAAGKVTGLTLHQNGQPNVPAKRTIP